MTMKEEFKNIMQTQTEIALATSLENIPNVRIVNFYYDEVSNIVYFTSFEENEKVKAFELNSNVAFTTIPHQGERHVRIKGTVKKSKRTIYDLADCFIEKMPSYKEIVEQAAQFLVVFEIQFDTAVVTLDLENTEVISL